MSNGWLAAFALLFAASIAAFPVRAEPADAILTYSGPDREQKLIAGARAEGQVLIYSGLIGHRALRPLTESFMKKYPFLKASYWRADAGQIAQKVADEVREKAVLADVVEGAGLGELLMRTELMAPYYTPALAAYPKKYRDPKGLWAATRISYFGLAFNTALVSPEKAPQSYQDLLDPQWVGKLAWRISSASGAPLFLTNLRLAWGEEKARAYFEKLKDQDMINFGSGSARTLLDRVIAGEYPIALNVYVPHVLAGKKRGAAVDVRLVSPFASTAAMMVVPRLPPHPHAAMLLVDYLLSADGQRIVRDAGYLPAHPEAAAPILAAVPSSAKAVENFISPDAANAYRESSEKIFEELFR